MSTEKPLMVARQEFIEKLAELINTSGLHMTIMQPIIADVNSQMLQMLQKEYEQEKKEYESRQTEDVDNG